MLSGFLRLARKNRADAVRRAERYEFGELARYNSERARGIVHAPEWDERMARDQERFNAKMLAEARARGDIIVGWDEG